MKITFLGSGNAFTPERDCATILVDDAILLDAGPGVLLNLKRLHIPPADIRYVFISHFHADHFFGIPFLLLEYHFLSRTDTPLTIIGPAGIERMVRQVMELAYPDVAQRGWPRPMCFIEVTPGAVQSAGDFSFRAFPMAHGNAQLTAYGYRLYLESGVLAYSGDTAMTEQLLNLIEGARVLILEAASSDESIVHLGRDDIRRLLDQIPSTTHVVLNHLDIPGEEAWQGMNVLIPHDRQTFEF